MRLTALIAILVGVVGAAWSWKLLQWYLSANTALYCVLGAVQQCASVFASASSYFYGTPIHLLAVGWFSLLAVIAGVRAYGVRSASRIGLPIAALCIPTIIYLDYIMIAIIHAICSDCELAHILGLILFALFIIMYRSDKKSSANETWK
ncbi:MAG: vitamin K epoxide reductase family protein [Candidatus Bathyarchaeia archaeon]